MTGLTLTVPVACQMPSAQATCWTPHAVTPGETPSWIALEYGVTVQELYIANGFEGLVWSTPGQTVGVPVCSNGES